MIHRSGLHYPGADLPALEEQVTEADRDPPSAAWRSVRLIVAIWAIWATSLLAFQEIYSVDFWVA